MADPKKSPAELVAGLRHVVELHLGQFWAKAVADAADCWRHRDGPWRDYHAALAPP